MDKGFNECFAMDNFGTFISYCYYLSILTEKFVISTGLVVHPALSYNQLVS